MVEKNPQQKQMCLSMVEFQMSVCFLLTLYVRAHGTMFTTIMLYPIESVNKVNKEAIVYGRVYLEQREEI